MSWELNTVAVCPRCQCDGCMQLDAEKVQCSQCGEVFLHPVLITSEEEKKAA